MDFSSLTGLPLDDSSFSVIAMVAGMLGGYWINGQLQQLKARRAKVPLQKK